MSVAPRLLPPPINENTYSIGGCNSLALLEAAIAWRAKRRCRQYCLGSGHIYGFCESCGRHTHRPPEWIRLPPWAKARLRLAWFLAWYLTWYPVRHPTRHPARHPAWRSAWSLTRRRRRTLPENRKPKGEWE